MNPWFDPYWAWLPGTALGMATGLVGGLVGAVYPVEARRARWGRQLVSAVAVLLAASIAVLAVGLTALAIGQPRSVWYGCLLPGIVVTGGLVFLRGMMKRHEGPPRQPLNPSGAS